MLNEVYQAAIALERRGAKVVELHSHLDPMGGNARALIVEVDEKAAPVRLSIVSGEIAGKLLRVCHGSKGSAFPGFNLPTPLRTFEKAEPERLGERVKKLRQRRAEVAWIRRWTLKLYARSKLTGFTDEQRKQFRQSVQDLAGWLYEDLAAAPPELASFKRLAQIVREAGLELASFAERLSTRLATLDGEFSAEERLLMAEWLFTERQLPIYLDLADASAAGLRVADPRTGRALNSFFLDKDPPAYDAATRRKTTPQKRKKNTASPELSVPVRDAYTGRDCTLPAKFPNPKLAKLGNTRLFSNNTTEARCFFRYGLADMDTFKVSPETVHKLGGAIFTLAGDDDALTALGGQVAGGRTCRELPRHREEANQLLIAYLESEPDGPHPYVDIFGTTASDFNAPDYGEATKKILDTLDAQEAKSPNDHIRLFAIAQVDKENKQVSLNRSFTVRELNAAAKAWQAGARNCPPITLTVWDKATKQPLVKKHIVPGPMDMALVLNQVWKTDAKAGLASYFLEALSRSDALDIFLATPQLRERKARYALAVLLSRIRPVFARAAIFKVTRNFNELAWLYKRRPFSEEGRRDVLKAAALIGILLHKLDQLYATFMKDTLYQIGQLLALADELHFHYCKWVRTPSAKREQKKVDAPSELLGNALFNAALDSPVRALARLASRIQPYKGWARTYCGDGAGTARWLLDRMADCERGITKDLEELQSLQHLDDVQKAQLLLGYLADRSDAQEPKTSETVNQ